MPTPNPRTRITIGRGSYANLLASVADLAEGEIVLATDQGSAYVKHDGQLVQITAEDAVTSVNGEIGEVVLTADDVGAATAAQGGLADSAMQPGQNVSELTNDAGYITSEDVPESPVTSVNSKTGVVVLNASDVGAATAAQGLTADSALQAGDNISDLVNDAGYITAEGVPDSPVVSVNGETGEVVLDKSDIGLDSVDNTSDADKPVSTATQTALDSKADLVNGVVPNSQLPSIAISEYLGVAADEAAMLALNGQQGDWCIRTDLNNTWVVTGSDSSVLSGWTELATPADLVTSVNGYQGAVVLGPADVGAATDEQGVLADSAIQPGDVNPVYFANQADFPSATDYHGGLAHSHADGAMYFAHGGAWNKLANDASVPDGSAYIEKAPASNVSQNVSGDLTLGTDKITLDASDGSIIATGSTNYFDGTVEIGGTNRDAMNIVLENTGKITAAGDAVFGPNNTGSAGANLDGVYLGATGYVSLYHTDSNTSNFINCRIYGTTDPVFSVSSNGSITANEIIANYWRIDQLEELT